MRLLPVCRIYLHASGRARNSSARDPALFRAMPVLGLTDPVHGLRLVLAQAADVITREPCWALMARSSPDRRESPVRRRTSHPEIDLGESCQRRFTTSKH